MLTRSFDLAGGSLRVECASDREATVRLDFPVTATAMREIIRAWRTRGTVQLVFLGELRPQPDPGVGSPGAPGPELDMSSASRTAAFL